MKDRFGNDITVGWAAHEILWIEAALTLDGLKRASALQDIASMSGRTLGAVKGCVKRIMYERRMVSYYADVARSRICIAEREAKVKAAKELRLRGTASSIRHLTPAEKMTGRVAKAGL